MKLDSYSRSSLATYHVASAEAKYVLDLAVVV